jgi:SAM-dependent methyltransferase
MTVSSNKILEENRAYYNRNAHRYEAASWYFFNAYKDKAVLEELQCCTSALSARSDLRVLEIGPGTGYLLHRLLSFEGRRIFYMGIEHSEVMSGILRERFAARCAEFTIVNQSVTPAFILGQLSSARFDLIIGSSILHHLPEHQQVIKALAGLLVEGGVLYIVREPIHQDECQPATAFTDLIERCYHGLNTILMSPIIRKRLWPDKLKAEPTVRCQMNDGVTTRAFLELEQNGFVRLFHRKYNRRVSAFLSYFENKWLAGIRKDIHRNTLWSFTIQRR